MSLSNKIRGLREVWLFDNRLWLAVTRVFFRNETLQVYRYNGIEFLTDHAGGDANGAREVFATDMYRRFIPQMAFPGPINVLDLGANNGGFPLLLHAAGLDLKRVVSVELNPQTFLRLEFNLKRNLECDVFPLNAALCGSDRTIEVSLGKGSVSDSIYQDPSMPVNNQNRYSIRGRTLDHFADEYFPGEVIDICKIDVEGAEFEVFAGDGIAALARCRYLIMEIHERDGRRKEEIVPVIESMGLAYHPPGPDADPTVHFFVNSKQL
ncbi:MAG TPA: FkbM family methyltransferase [Pyrinomonadaceae bacterium]|nr:FkbM family methyltransferase [Pyrinomonadaceae bacterium]